MPRRAEGGNFISEWFGHRIYPNVVASEQSLRDQREKRCPFLTRVKEAATECVKSDSSKGVCTISSCSNGPRQDWLACPYRAFEPGLLDRVAARCYGVTDPTRLHTLAAPTVAREQVQTAMLAELAAGDRVLVYFDQKIGSNAGIYAALRRRLQTYLPGHRLRVVGCG